MNGLGTQYVALEPVITCISGMGRYDWLRKDHTPHITLIILFSDKLHNYI